MGLALRWAVFARRFEVAESTLGGNLRGLRYLYVWGAWRFNGGLESRLQEGPLGASDLTNLKEFLRAPDVEDCATGTPGTTGGERGANTADTAAGARALAALLFLRWAISPLNRNERGAEPADARDALTQLDVILGPLANRAGQGGERQAPTMALLDLMEERIRPVQDEEGRFRVPLQWKQDNPFKPATRLRNWLMWQIARDCGPRIGELLALKLQDVRQLDGEWVVTFVRRPDDAEDTRIVRPQVKTLARAVPMSPYVTFAYTAYLRERGSGRRRRGSPFLFTSTHGSGRPLSVSAAGLVMQELSRAAKNPITWHLLRHAWATDIARHVLEETTKGRRRGASDAEAMQALLVEQLRVLGGWAVTSREPMRYAKTAIHEHAVRTLRDMQQQRADHFARRRGSGTDAELAEILSPDDTFSW